MDDFDQLIARDGGKPATIAHLGAVVEAMLKIGAQLDDKVRMLWRASRSSKSVRPLNIAASGGSGARMKTATRAYMPAASGCARRSRRRRARRGKISTRGCWPSTRARR